MSTFEDNINLINTAIAQHSNSWTLKSRADIDYDDISQLIRLHIYKKIHQWDSSRPIVPWLHRIIKNQIINLLRNVYTNMSRPCLRCPQAIGDDGCTLYIKQCGKCPLYSKWEKTKKQKYNVNLPLSMEFHTDEMHSIPNQDIDFIRAIPILNKRLKLVLKDYEWQFYDLMYIQNKTTPEVGKIMDFKNNEPGTSRFKRIEQLKQTVMKKAADILKEYGLEN